MGWVAFLFQCKSASRAHGSHGTSHGESTGCIASNAPQPSKAPSSLWAQLCSHGFFHGWPRTERWGARVDPQKPTENSPATKSRFPPANLKIVQKKTYVVQPAQMLRLHRQNMKRSLANTGISQAFTRTQLAPWRTNNIPLTKPWLLLLNKFKGGLNYSHFPPGRIWHIDTCSGRQRVPNGFLGSLLSLFQFWSDFCPSELFQFWFQSSPWRGGGDGSWPWMCTQW